MVSFVGDRHTVILDSLDNRSGLKAVRSMRKRNFGEWAVEGTRAAAGA